jgi:hypothetical protein
MTLLQESNTVSNNNLIFLVALWSIWCIPTYGGQCSSWWYGSCNIYYALIAWVVVNSITILVNSTTIRSRPRRPGMGRYRIHNNCGNRHWVSVDFNGKYKMVVIEQESKSLSFTKSKINLFLFCFCHLSQREIWQSATISHIIQSLCTAWIFLF